MTRRLSDPPQERLRLLRYLAVVREKPCLICGDKAEAHHINYAQPKALSRKNSDEYTVPMCHRHHMEMHNAGIPEKTWWAMQGINPMVWSTLSYKRWKNEHPDD
jgi:hypothetical protein